MLLHVKFAHKDGAKAGATAEVIADRLEPSTDAATSVTMTDVEAEAASDSAMFSISNVPPVSTMPSVQVVVPTSTVSSVPHMGAALTVSSVPHVATAPTVSSIPGIAAMSALSRVPNVASVSTVSLVPGIAAVTTVSMVPDVASVSTVSSAACVAPVPTMPPIPGIVSYTVTASDNTVAPDQDMEAATDSVALPSPSMTSDGMVELEPVQEITELTRMEPGSHEHAAVEHLFASIQQPTASLPVVADGPPLTVVGSAQHMLHMLSVSQVEEVVSEVCLPQNSCPNVW